MRYSRAAVQMFDLGRLVEGVAGGTLGVPEFQRDFDWSETDIRALLASVFAGWPAGSLLLLDGRAAMFSLRPFETAPRLSHEIEYAVLDGQQRLTSLYQALYDTGESVFAVKWDILDDQELEESIVSYPSDIWKKSFATHEAQVERRIIPVSALRSPTAFFSWRDQILSCIPDEGKADKLKRRITDFYTHQLSSIHDYEFPVVILDRRTEPFAIARIFERVNRTGLKLGAFDLMVAKSFDINWNLRDRWLEARQDYRDINTFLEDDGMPLLQAIALLERGDLRQSSVLQLTKHQVQQRWPDVVGAAARTVAFLRSDCGVLRRDFIPYGNLLPPLIALETEGVVSNRPKDIATWFWYSSFASAYDAAANTRLVAHFKAVRSGKVDGFYLGEERAVRFHSATKKNEKAIYFAVACAIIKFAEHNAGMRISDSLTDELEISTLYSENEVFSSLFHRGWEGESNTEFRSALNSYIVPKQLVPIVRKLTSTQSVEQCLESDFSDFAIFQLPGNPLDESIDWGEFRERRVTWLVDFLMEVGIWGVNIIHPDAGGIGEVSTLLIRQDR